MINFNLTSARKNRKFSHAMSRKLFSQQAGGLVRKVQKERTLECPEGMANACGIAIPECSAIDMEDLSFYINSGCNVKKNSVCGKLSAEQRRDHSRRQQNVIPMEAETSAVPGLPTAYHLVASEQGAMQGRNPVVPWTGHFNGIQGEAGFDEVNVDPSSGRIAAPERVSPSERLWSNIWREQIYERNARSSDQQGNFTLLLRSAVHDEGMRAQNHVLSSAGNDWSYRARDAGRYPYRIQAAYEERKGNGYWVPEQTSSGSNCWSQEERGYVQCPTAGFIQPSHQSFHQHNQLFGNHQNGQPYYSCTDEMWLRCPAVQCPVLSENQELNSPFPCMNVSSNALFYYGEEIGYVTPAEYQEYADVYL